MHPICRCTGNVRPAAAPRTAPAAGLLSEGGGGLPAAESTAAADVAKDIRSKRKHMDFLELAKKRYSCRAYRNDEVEQEKLDPILEAGRIAPTGANRQPQRILVVRTPDGMEKLARCARTCGAPLALVVCADTEEAWIRPADGKQIADIDATIVTAHMMLEAASLGLGSLWVCMFDPDGLRREFMLPARLTPVNILLVGYADGTPASPDRYDRTRKALAETVVYDTFERFE